MNTWTDMKRVKVVKEFVEVEHKVECPFQTFDGTNLDVFRFNVKPSRYTNYSQYGEFYFETRTSDKNNAQMTCVMLNREHLVAMRDTIDAALNS